MQCFLYVVKDKAIVFRTQLMRDFVPWRRSAHHQLLPDNEAKTVPSSWSESQVGF